MKDLFNSGDYQHILDRVARLTAGSKAQWGKMNVNEMICHISDPFRDLLKLRITPPTIPTAFLRWVIKKILLGSRPLSKNAPTSKPYLQGPKGGGTKPVNFDQDIATLKSLLSRFVCLDPATSLGNHGTLGKLSREDASWFMWKHLDHHLRQFGV